MPIIECRGSLLDDDADVLVNTTNVSGPRGPTMGKGLAKAFADRWPAIVKPYRDACAAGDLKAGRCRLYPLPEPLTLFTAPRQRYWAAFCTKGYVYDKSQYPWIGSGLADLVEAMAQGGCLSVAIPALGCSNGGLLWSRVKPMIEEAFAGSPAAVHLYGPTAHLD